MKTTILALTGLLSTLSLALPQASGTTTSASTVTVTAPCTATPTVCPATDQTCPCAPQAVGYGFPVYPDTPQAFALDPLYALESLLTPTPKGYTEAFRELNGSVLATSTTTYLGYYLLQTYNVTGCASLCTANTACEAFNVFVERDPLLFPAAACPNPPSTINYKCTLVSYLTTLIQEEEDEEEHGLTFR